MIELPNRDQIKIGMKVSVELKQDQGSNKLTEGIVKEILTSGNLHPYGIKVKLETDEIGRVKEISSQESKTEIKQAEETIPSSNSIPNEEDEYNEFKESFQHDVQDEELRNAGKIEIADNRKKNKNLNEEIKKEVALTIAAFGNKSGGKLFIGVNDKGEPIGIDYDLNLQKNSKDKLSIAIVESLKTFLKNTAFIATLKLSFPIFEEKTICLIKVTPSQEPIFVNWQNKQEFYVRIMTRSEKLDNEDMLKHCNIRFPK